MPLVHKMMCSICSEWDRPGDLHSSVGTFDAQAGGFTGPKWRNLTEMYAATPFPTTPPRSRTPHIDEHHLRWSVVDL